MYITFSILFGLPGGQCTLLSQYRLVYQEDSVRVSIDYSGPEIDVQGLRGRWNTEGLYIHNTTDLSTMVLVLTAADPHSGLSTLQWTLSTHPLTDDVGRGAVGVQRLDNTVIIRLQCDIVNNVFVYACNRYHKNVILNIMISLLSL